MSQISVRLDDAELRRLDSLVEGGRFRSRAEAARAAIRMLSRAAHEEQIVVAYMRAYEKTPLTDDEQRMLDAATTLSVESLR